MTGKVTPIRPALSDELTSLLLESDTFILIGKSEGQLRLATNADQADVYMMLEAMKIELMDCYIDDVLGEPEVH